MEQEKEIWKDIPGYEGLYECSDLGRIKSLSNGKYKKEKILKNSPNGHGYTKNQFSINGLDKTQMTHITVAKTFLGYKNENRSIVIDHINGIKNDNKLCNLRIVTARENVTTCYINKNRKTTSQHPGVSYHKRRRKYQSVIQVKGVRIYLGIFKEEIDAANAYQAKLKEILSLEF